MTSYRDTTKKKEKPKQISKATTPVVWFVKMPYGELIGEFKQSFFSVILCSRQLIIPYSFVCIQAPSPTGEAVNAK
jgi:hypothetical protein